MYFFGGVEAVGVPCVQADAAHEHPVHDGFGSLDQRVLVGVVAFDQEVGLGELL